MPELKSKKREKSWKDEQSFYNDYVKVDPSAKKYSPSELWEAARTSGEYDFIDDDPQPVVTQPPPTATSKPFNPVNMLYNLPSSSAKQAREMGSGAVAAYKFLDPTFSNPTDNMYAQAVKSINEKGLGGAAQSGFQTASNVLGAVKDQYKDRYFNGKFLENLENDPAAIAADVASFVPIAGWAAKGAGMAKTAKVLNKIATVADLASSPIPAASAVVSRAPIVANRVARAGMKYSLQLPKEMHETELIGRRRMPSAADYTTREALDNGFTMTKKGQRQQDAAYLKALDKMKELELSATNAGVGIEKSAVRNAAIGDALEGNKVLDHEAAKAAKMLDDLLDNPNNFGQLPTISPVKASSIRTELNKSTPPKAGVSRTTSEGMQSQVELATGDAIREVLGNTIPGQREAALKAMNAKRLADTYTRYIAGKANAGIIPQAQPGALGLAGGNIIQAKVLSPVVMGLGAKYFLGPQMASWLSSKVYSKAPAKLRGIDRALRGPAQPVGQALKQAGKPNPLRPFAEDDEPRQVNPLRPFPEE